MSVCDQCFGIDYILQLITVKALIYFSFCKVVTELEECFKSCFDQCGMIHDNWKLTDYSWMTYLLYYMLKGLAIAKNFYNFI